MIANITGGKDIKGVIMYNENKVSRGEAEFIYAKDAMSHSVNAKIGSFDPFLVMNKNTRDVSFHVSLNLPHKTNLSNEVFIKIGEEYMKKMGYGNNPFLIYKHEDRKHQHIHIVSCRVDENGNKIKDSLERVHSQKICDQLIEKYNLPKVNRRKKREKAVAESPLSLNKDYTKSKMYAVIKHVQKEYIPTNIVEYNQLLKRYKLECKEKKGVLENGEGYYGLNYKLGVNADSNVSLQEQIIIKSSNFNNIIQSKELDKFFLKNTPKKEKARKEILNKFKPIEQLIVQQEIKSFEDLDKELKKIQIETVYHKNKKETTGLAFIDVNSGAYFKASDVSRKLTYNGLNKKFNQSGENYQEVSKSISAVLSKYKTNSLYEFNLLLNQKKTETVKLFYDKKTKNYKVSIQDQANKLTFVDLNELGVSSEKLNSYFNSNKDEKDTKEALFLEVYKHYKQNNDYSYISTELQKSNIETLKDDKGNLLFVHNENGTTLTESSFLTFVDAFEYEIDNGVGGEMKSYENANDETADGLFKKKKKRKRGKGL